MIDSEIKHHSLISSHKLAKTFVNNFCYWSWEIKLGAKELVNEIAQGRKYSKIRPVSSSLQKSFAGGSRPLGPKKLPGTASWSSQLMILLLFHLPAKKCSKSWRCVKPGPWFPTLQDIRRTNAAKPFQSSSSSV